MKTRTYRASDITSAITNKILFSTNYKWEYYFHRDADLSTYTFQRYATADAMTRIRVMQMIIFSHDESESRMARNISCTFTDHNYAPSVVITALGNDDLRIQLNAQDVDYEDVVVAEYSGICSDGIQPLDISDETWTMAAIKGAIERIDIDVAEIATALFEADRLLIERFCAEHHQVLKDYGLRNPYNG